MNYCTLSCIQTDTVAVGLVTETDIEEGAVRDPVLLDATTPTDTRITRGVVLVAVLLPPNTCQGRTKRERRASDQRNHLRLARTKTNQSHRLLPSLAKRRRKVVLAMVTIRS